MFRGSLLLILLGGCAGEATPTATSEPATAPETPTATDAATAAPAAAPTPGDTPTPEAPAVPSASGAVPAAPGTSSAPAAGAGAPPAAPAAPAAAAPVTPGPSTKASGAPVAAAPAGPVPAATPAAVPDAPPATPPAAVPTVATYNLDPARSSLFVQVFKDTGTVGAGLSHNHVIAATGWTGSVTWDPADLSKCAVSFSVPVSGLRPDEDALRKRVGYDVMLEPDQRADIGDAMRGSSQLDAKKYATITYTSRKCEAAGDRVKITGDLTVHGTTKPVTATFAVAADGATFTGNGTFKARATDFGFQPYTALLGALKNQDEMKFTVDVKGTTR